MAGRTIPEDRNPLASTSSEVSKAGNEKGASKVVLIALVDLMSSLTVDHPWRELYELELSSPLPTLPIMSPLPIQNIRPPSSHDDGADVVSVHSSTQLSKRASRSPSSKARVRIKNRRKRYLDSHPEYFSSPSLELADPLAYDRLVRRFQTTSEREAEGRKKGYSGVLEADLWRSEAKVDALANPDATSMRYMRDASGEIVAEEKDEVPPNKEEGLQRWHKEMEMMFLRGEDPDFEYVAVDEDDAYDNKGIEESEEEEKYFDEEEPTWLGLDQDLETTEASNAPTGQTGVQDY